MLRRLRDAHKPQLQAWWCLPGIAVLAATGLAVAFIVSGGTDGLHVTNSPVGAGEQASPRASGESSTPASLLRLEQSAPAAAEITRTAPAPHLPPGEPSVHDVQAWDWLQQDCEQLLAATDRDARDRLEPDTFREEFVGVMVDFLELDDEAAGRFRAKVSSALTEIGAAREAMERTRQKSEEHSDWRRPYAAGWEEFRSSQHAAVRHLLEALDERPRHQLLREQALKWLLRLDYGMRAARR